MSEKHLAERLMYPLPDGWRDDPEQVAALKEIWPKIITKNKELIDAEITSLRAQLEASQLSNKLHLQAIETLRAQHNDEVQRCAGLTYQLDEARRKAIEECMAVVIEMREGFLSPEYATGQPLSSMNERIACSMILNNLTALLSESKS